MRFTFFRSQQKATKTKKSPLFVFLVIVIHYHFPSIMASTDFSLDNAILGLGRVMPPSITKVEKKPVPIDTATPSTTGEQEEEKEKRQEEEEESITPTSSASSDNVETTAPSSPSQSPPSPSPPPPSSSPSPSMAAIKNNKGEFKKQPTTRKDISTIVGEIQNEYKCVHKNVPGNLYAGPKGVCFLGRVFFLEWTVIARWVDVVHIELLEKGIRVRVTSNGKNNEGGSVGGLSYDFGDSLFPLHNPDRVFTTLISLHNDAIKDKGVSNGREASTSVTAAGNTQTTTTSTPRTQERSVRRINSDLVRSSQYYSGDFGSTTELHNDDNKQHVSNNLSAAAKKEISSSSRSDAPTDSTLQHVPLQKTESDPGAGSKNGKDSTTGSSMKDQWSKELSDTASYSEMAVQNHELDCDLDVFISMFLSNGAKYSIPVYMKENGDDEIQSSEWEPSNSTSTSIDGDRASSSQSRKIEYTHPVNAPMAPPMARARKEQSLRRYEGYGLIVETKTFVDDVPMTDCFYVADRLRVERRGEGKVAVTMQFDIRFVKSTMFKSIISRTTKREIDKFMNQFARFMSKSLGNEDVTIVHEAEPAPVLKPAASNVTPPQTPPGGSSRLPMYVMLGSVLALQLWLLFDLRSMRTDIRQLQMTCAGMGMDSSPK